MKLYLIFVLCFLLSSLFNTHPHKNDFKTNLESNNQTLEALLNDL